MGEQINETLTSSHLHTPIFPFISPPSFSPPHFSLSTYLGPVEVLGVSSDLGEEEERGRDDGLCGELDDMEERGREEALAMEEE